MSSSLIVSKKRSRDDTCVVEASSSTTAEITKKAATSTTEEINSEVVDKLKINQLKYKFYGLFDKEWVFKFNIEKLIDNYSEEKIDELIKIFELEEKTIFNSQCREFAFDILYSDNLLKVQLMKTPRLFDFLIEKIMNDHPIHTQKYALLILFAIFKDNTGSHPSIDINSIISRLTDFIICDDVVHIPVCDKCNIPSSDSSEIIISNKKCEITKRSNYAQLFLTAIILKYPELTDMIIANEMLISILLKNALTRDPDIDIYSMYIFFALSIAKPRYIIESGFLKQMTDVFFTKNRTFKLTLYVILGSIIKTDDLKTYDYLENVVNYMITELDNAILEVRYKIIIISQLCKIIKCNPELSDTIREKDMLDIILKNYKNENMNIRIKIYQLVYLLCIKNEENRKIISKTNILLCSFSYLSFIRRDQYHKHEVKINSVIKLWISLIIDNPNNKKILISELLKNGHIDTLNYYLDINDRDTCENILILIRCICSENKNISEIFLISGMFLKIPKIIRSGDTVLIEHALAIIISIIINVPFSLSSLQTINFFNISISIFLDSKHATQKIYEYILLCFLKILKKDISFSSFLKGKLYVYNKIIQFCHDSCSYPVIRGISINIMQKIEPDYLAKLTQMTASSPLYSLQQISCTDDCHICGEANAEEKFVVLPCSHKFHFGCIKQWTDRQNKTCPYCRQNIIKLVNDALFK